MKRSLVLAAALSVLMVAVSYVAPVRGQVAVQDTTLGGGGRPPPMPLAVDLRKVTVGAWAQYQISNGGPQMSIRLALVSRSPSGVDIETTMEGAPATVGNAVMRMTVPVERSGAAGKPRGQVLQMGNDDPMLLPDEVAGMQADAFTKPDPKKRVGRESVTVPAGTFKAEHYRDRDGAGGTIDFWVNKEVPPFGLVKLTTTPAPGARVAGVSGIGADAPSPPLAQPLAMVLMSRGADAKPVITRAPKPFDTDAVMKRMKAAMDAAPAGAGGRAGRQAAPPPAK